MEGSSGTPDSWTPLRWPDDKEASDELRQWIEQRAGGESTEYYGSQLDYRGADLSDADFTESWLSGADLRGVRLQRVVLFRGHAEGANFSGADLEGADLARASLWDANFTDARLVNTRLWRAEALDAVFVNANLAGADFGDGSLSGSDLTGANLSDAQADKLGLIGCRFDHTKVTGFTGTVIGPVIVSVDGKDTELDNEELEQWFAEHGASVTRFHAEPPPHPEGAHD